MGITIAVINQKGGVGKTTTCVNLADALVREGKTVLVMDLDPQGNCTDCFSVTQDEIEKTIYEVLIEDEPIENVAIKLKDGLYLVPSTMHMSDGERILSSKNYRETYLKKAIAKMQVDLDFIILDCPPSLNTISLNALSAADEVLITLQAEYLAAFGLTQLSATIDEVKENINPNLSVLGILITMFDSRLAISKEIVADLSERFPGLKVFQSKIRRNVALADASAQGKTIFDYKPRSPGAKAYAALAKEILADEIEVKDETPRK
jgi:chromosome partitioning protein